MRLFLCLGVVLALLASCTTKQPFADDAAVAAVAYREPGPATITLYTMIRNQTGSGGHSSLLINASERVIFDPAGSFYSDLVPERNDVLFGISPRIEQAYRSGHARSTYHVLSQTIEVTPEQAETAYRLALANGPTPRAFCASATSALLRSVPGFEGLKSTMYPTNLSQQFAKLPGVRESRYYEDDNPDLQTGLAANNEKLLSEDSE